MRTAANKRVGNSNTGANNNSIHSNNNAANNATNNSTNASSNTRRNNNHANASSSSSSSASSAQWSWTRLLLFVLTAFVLLVAVAVSLVGSGGISLHFVWLDKTPTTTATTTTTTTTTTTNGDDVVDQNGAVSSAPPPPPPLPQMSLTAADLEQIRARGSSVDEVERQLKFFRDGFPPARLVRPTTVGDGIVRLSESEADELFVCYSSKKKKKMVSLTSRFFPVALRRVVTQTTLFQICAGIRRSQSHVQIAFFLS